MAEIGNQEAVNSVSTETFTTALITNVVIFAIELIAFTILFRYLKHIYQPRTYLPRLVKDRVAPLPDSIWRWFVTVWKADRTQIIEKNGLDAYMFLQFLYMMLWIFVPIWVISWAILLPVNSSNSNGTLEGLYIYTFGNVGLDNQNRYAAHIILVYFFTFWVFYLINREYGNFIRLRHKFLSSAEHTALAQSRTVLVTGLPSEFRHTRALHKLAEYLPGGAAQIWLTREISKEMQDLYDRQVKACQVLEGAETNFMKTAAKNQMNKRKAEAKKKGKKGKETDGKAEENGLREDAQSPAGYDAEKRAVTGLEGLVAKKDRPTRKLSAIPFMGKKVDSIDWAKDELVEVKDKLEDVRSKMGHLPAEGSAFIQFHSQIAAHIFQQATIHHLPLRMSKRYIEVGPEDVIFPNLGIDPYQAKIRYLISWGATIGLIIGWAFPVTFVGLLSNVNQLCAEVSWLAWLCGLPVPLNGILQGVLPPVALALLFLVLPIILRLLARFEGIPLRSLVEVSLMTRYFVFLVIHGFLITTLASGLVAAIPDIVQDPASTVTILAQNLPLASNFFLTYFVTTGLSGAAGAFLSLATLILHYIFVVLLSSSPRKVFGLKFQMRHFDFGTVFPNMTLLTVIGLAYSVIAPLINGFAVLAFALFAFAYKYLLIWVVNFPPVGETGGLFFPIAIDHIFVGLYIEELCLTGLFFLARDSQGDVSCLPQAILMIILIVTTLFYHLSIKSGYGPLVRNLPMDLGITADEASRGNPAMSAAAKNDILAIEKQAKEAARRLKSAPTRVTKFAGGITSGITGGLMRRRNSEEEIDMPPAFRESEQIELRPTANSSSDSIGGPIHRVTSSRREITEEERAGLVVQEHGFDQPATWKEQETIWLPDDVLGIGRAECAHLLSLGIDASTEGAQMDAQGKTNVSRPPPGEPWEQEDVPDNAEIDNPDEAPTRR